MCACGWAAAGASRPHATSLAPAPRRRSRARSPWPRPSPRARRRRWRRSRPPAGTGPRTGTSTPSRSPWRTSSSSSSQPRRALRGDERIVRTMASSSATRERKSFASTEGAACTQERVAAGAGIVAYATDGSELQVRSYPTAHGGGESAAAGWEHVLGLDLVGHAPRVASEAVELFSAPPCPEGRRTIVLHGEQVALQVHESIGHALELDRILLRRGLLRRHELGVAGGPRVAALRLPAAARHGGRDAPGRPGLVRVGRRGRRRRARTDLVADGVLRAALSDRGSAAAIGLGESGGCARADGFARQPIVRMTNVSLEPGDVPSLARPRRRHRATASTWRRTDRGRSTTAGCSSSSSPSCVARSAAASSVGSTATPPTRA